MNLQPMNDRVLVRRIEEPRTESLIFVPDVAQEPSLWAQVVAVGPGRLTNKGRVPMAVQVGQVVVIGPYTDWESSQDGELVLIQEADIRGIVEKA